jgi:anti-anti-sigma factor
VADEQAIFAATVDRDSTGARLTLKGDLDLSSAPQLEARLAALRPLWRPLTMEVSDLSFVDSVGLRSLILASRAAIEDYGGPVKLVGCRNALGKLLEITGVSDAFERV